MSDLIKLVSLMKGEIDSICIIILVKQYEDVRITASIRIIDNGNYIVFVYANNKKFSHREWSYKHRQHLIDNIKEYLEECLWYIETIGVEDITLKMS